MDAITQTGLSEALTDCARACRVLEMEGHGEMTLGHLSLRDPLTSDPALDLVSDPALALSPC